MDGEIINELRTLERSAEQSGSGGRFS